MKTKTFKSAGGFTLVEMMITVLISTILFATVISTFLFFNKTFVAVGNYVEMNQVNRNAIDTMSQRIRQTQSLLLFSTTNLVFKDAIGTNTLSYSYNPTDRTLSQQDTNGIKVVLTECDSLSFNIAQRNPSNSFNFYPATAATAKVISMTWSTSRTILGSKVNTESVQTARVVMRN
jgi:prepilin-type N-terminal cleavage/methylation domain-containing protein